MTSTEIKCKLWEILATKERLSVQYDDLLKQLQAVEVAERTAKEKKDETPAV